jgi:hypothetical protein
MQSSENLKGTYGEEAVNTLAYDTYLKYWCYPGPKDEQGSKKEICDLLILFKETMIILSVKNYEFKGNYERYFRSTLDKAVSQVAGAERRLLDTSRKLFFRHADLGEIEFDPAQYKQIFRIIVNHSAAPLFYPGGRLTVTNQYVHIFNWDAFLGIVRELDTIPDFIQYLSERQIILHDRDTTIINGSEEEWEEHVQQAFLDYNINRLNNIDNYFLISGTESDLLADYLWNNRKFNKHLYDKSFNGGSFELDGKWQEYLKTKEVQSKKQADRASYFVDEFLKNEVLYEHEPRNLELAVELLSLSRFERRIVGEEFLAFWTKYQNVGKDFIVRRYGKVNDLVIAFVLYSRNMPHDMVISLMQIAAEGYAVWNKYVDRKIAIIGFSQDAIGFRFGLMNVEPFPKQLEEQVNKDLTVLKWFTNFEVFEIKHKEYPE